MKTLKDHRSRPERGSDEFLKQAVKLDPIKKSGKERHHIYSALDDEGDDDDSLEYPVKKESVFDYLDEEAEEG